MVASHEHTHGFTDSHLKRCRDFYDFLQLNPYLGREHRNSHSIGHGQIATTRGNRLRRNGSRLSWWWEPGGCSSSKFMRHKETTNGTNH